MEKIPNDFSEQIGIMDRNQYWTIMECSLTCGDDQETQLDFLREALRSLPLKDLAGFQILTDQLRYESYTTDLWCACFLMNDGASDDCFEYFRCWLITRGREVFENAVKNPDSLTDVVTGDEEFFDCESLMYLASEVFEERTGEENDLNEYINYEKFSLAEGNYPKPVFRWSEDDPESQKKICPRLYAMYAQE